MIYKKGSLIDDAVKYNKDKELDSEQIKGALAVTQLLVEGYTRRKNKQKRGEK